MKLEGGREKLSEERLLPPPSNLPSPSPKTFVCGRRFRLCSQERADRRPFLWLDDSKSIYIFQNRQAFSVTCSLLHARNASNGRHAEKPLSAPQARKSCEQGFDNVKSLWGRGLSPERFPPLGHLLNEKSSSKGLRFCVVPLFQKGSTKRFYQRIESWSSQSLPSSTTCTATTPSRESAVSPTASSRRCATRSTSPSPNTARRIP